MLHSSARIRVHLDDPLVIAVRQPEQPLVAPAAHRQPHPDDRIAHAWLARIGRHAFAELVERLQPNLERLLETVLCDPAFEPEVSEPRAVRGLAQMLLGLVEQRIERRHVTDQQRGVSGVELQLPGQREVCGPSLLAEQVQGVPAVLEGQRERGLRPSLSCRPPQYVDEPGAFDVVGQPQATDADVACGFEYSVVPQRDQPPTDAQVNVRGWRRRTVRRAPPRPPGRG